MMCDNKSAASRIPKSVLGKLDHVVQIDVQLVSMSICGEQVQIYKRTSKGKIVLHIEVPIDEQLDDKGNEHRRFLVEKAYREVLLVHPHLVHKLNTIGDQKGKE